jgi:hypothetical protein
MKGGHHFGNRDLVDERIILKWIPEQYGVKGLSKFTFFRI